MKAVVTDGKGKLWVDEVPLPEVGPFDCLVRIECCAFCNSTDRHIVEGAKVFGLRYPALLGHESVGVIERIGARVRHFAVGDRVLRAGAAYPGKTLGKFASAWGGFAEYGKVTDWQAKGVPAGALLYQQKVPTDIDPCAAALLIPQKEVYSAAGKIGVVDGKRFLILGAGIVGLLFGQFLKLRGAALVATTARRREALDRIMQAQAADEVHELGAEEMEPGSFDALVETTGSLEAVRQVLPAISRGGTVHAYAVYEGGAAALAAAVPEHPVERLNPAEATAHEAVCDLVRRGTLQHSGLISHRFGIDATASAWQTVIQKRTMKTLVLMS